MNSAMIPAGQIKFAARHLPSPPRKLRTARHAATRRSDFIVATAAVAIGLWLHCPDLARAQDRHGTSEELAKASTPTSAPGLPAGSNVAASADPKDTGTARSDGAIDDLISGRLLKFGAAAGVAVTTQFDANVTDTFQRSWANAQIQPYVAWYPGMTFSISSTRAYCAALLNADDDKAASEALSIKAKNSRLTSRNLDEFESSDRPRCGWRRLGIVVGYPTNYTATVVLRQGENSASEARREIRPKVMFGVIFSPLRALSFVLGATMSTVQYRPIGSSPDSAEFEANLLTFGFGIATSSDIFDDFGKTSKGKDEAK